MSIAAMHPRPDNLRSVDLAVGDYHGHLDGSYDDPIPLPEPFGFDLDPSSLPRYGN